MHRAARTSEPTTISAHNSPQREHPKTGQKVGESLWELLTTDGVLEEITPEDANDTLLALDDGDASMAVLEVLVAAGRVTLADVRDAWLAHDAVRSALQREDETHEQCAGRIFTERRSK